MAKFANMFLVGLSDRHHAKYAKLIASRKAYLERDSDGSQILIVTNSRNKGEAIFARLPEATKATRIGNRIR